MNKQNKTMNPVFDNFPITSVFDFALLGLPIKDCLVDVFVILTLIILILFYTWGTVTVKLQTAAVLVPTICVGVCKND